MISGRCECSRIRYEINAEITDFSHCHCAQCRRLHGAAFATFAGVASDRFSYTSGADVVTSYASSDNSDRVFCGVCGSNILVNYKPEPDTRYIAMGTVDGNPSHPDEYHQFVASKAPWHEIRDDFKRYDEWPPD